MATIYLNLPPDQGGQKFGPFGGGTVQFGAHPSSNQISITSPGIAPVHCQLIDNNNGQFTLQPCERGLGLWLIQAGDQQLWPVGAPVLAKPGDAIVLGSEQGPRFTIEAGPAQPIAGAAGGGGGGWFGGGGQQQQGKPGLASGLQNEAMRQAKAKLMAKNPLFRNLNNMWFRYKSGSLMNPRVLLPIITTIFTVIAGGFVACAGGVLTLLQILTSQ